MNRQCRLNSPSCKVRLQLFIHVRAAPFLLFLLENIMKFKSFIPTVIALTLSVSALSSMAATPDELIGVPVPAAAAAEAADRTITITPDPQYVNVQGGDTVQFNVGGKTFAWDFDG